MPLNSRKTNRPAKEGIRKLSINYEPCSCINTKAEKSLCNWLNIQTEKNIGSANPSKRRRFLIVPPCVKWLINLCSRYLSRVKSMAAKLPPNIWRLLPFQRSLLTLRKYLQDCPTAWTYFRAARLMSRVLPIFLY